MGTCGESPVHLVRLHDESCGRKRNDNRPMLRRSSMKGKFLVIRIQAGLEPRSVIARKQGEFRFAALDGLEKSEKRGMIQFRLKSRRPPWVGEDQKKKSR